MDVRLPFTNCGIATCLNRAIGMTGLSPVRLRPCRPATSDPGDILNTRHARAFQPASRIQDCCLPFNPQRRLSLPVSRKFILKTTIIPISGLNTEPASLPSPASDFRYRFCLWGQLPVCWLSFNRVGLTLYVRLFSQCRSKLHKGTILQPYIPNAEASLAGGIKTFTHWTAISNFTSLRPIPSI